MSEEQDNSATGADAVAAEPPGELTPGGAAGPAAAPGKIDLDLLMDVQVTLSVEVGRTRLPIKELLALREGAVVNLDRAVSDPLDLMVNGTLIARGEVVESGGRFGLRLIEVVSPSERLRKLK